MLFFVLTGCSIQKNEEKQSGNNSNSFDQISQKRRLPDFQRPEGKASVSGIVKNILGNELTVLKIERQGGFEGGTNSGSKVAAKKTERKIQPLNITGLAGSARGGMRRGMEGGRPPVSENEDSDERLQILKELSMGEEKVIIPVGIKMLKNDDGEMVEATLEDIKKDIMLMIWTDQNISERNIANFVIIN